MVDVPDQITEAAAAALSEHHYDLLAKWVAETGQLPPRRSFCEQMAGAVLVALHDAGLVAFQGEIPPWMRKRGWIHDSKTRDSNYTVVLDAAGEPVYPCRCGETHRGPYGVYDYAHHNCFHDAKLVRLGVGYFMCPQCGKAFWDA